MQITIIRSTFSQLFEGGFRRFANFWFSRYIFDFPDKINVEKAFSDEKNKKIQKKSLSGLSKEAVLVYNSLVKPEFTVDDLSGLDIDGGALLSALTELEMEHLVTSLPGGLYKKS